jgi:hypothetical protein
MNVTLPNLKQMDGIKINKAYSKLVKISVFCLGAVVLFLFDFISTTT